MNSDFLTYNALDSACTKQVHDAFWQDLEPHGFLPAYQMTVDLLPVLMFMQTRGVKVNFPALEATKTEVLKSAAEKQEELNRIVGRELNVNSPKDCQAYFYIELGIPPYYNEGKITVDDLALQRLSRGTAKRPGLRQAKLVQEIRGLQKLHGTYLNLEFDADGRMRASYNPRGTKFGRLSSSKTIFGTGTNFQNLPQEFKKFLVADDGYLLWEVDKRQAEWVVVAYLTGDANMIKVIEEGRDTHIHTASLMFHCPPEVIEFENKMVGNNSDPDIIRSLRTGHEMIERFAHVLPRTMSGRQCGKKSNHGLNYDEGYVKFALINEMEQSEAKRITEMYHTIYPGIRVWYESIKRMLQRDRSLTNCFGRKIRFMDSWGPDLWKAGYSALPQSTVVDSLNQGIIKIYNDDNLTAVNHANIDILAQVHDSALLQIPIPVVQSAKFQSIMQRVYDYVSPTISYNGRDFKIATDSKIGLNWGGFHKEQNPMGMRALDSIEELDKLLGDMGVQPRTSRLD